jgi:hypothetical protein
MVVPRPDLRASQKHTTVVRLLVDVDHEPGRFVPLSVTARHRRAGQSAVQTLHAEVVIDVAEVVDVVVVDLKSTSGTYVNGRRVQSPVVVEDGDRIEAGDAVLEVRRRQP